MSQVLPFAILTAITLANRPPIGESVGQVLDRFREAHAKMEALTVEFDIHRFDRFLQQQEQAGHGTVRVRRLPGGEFMARCDMTVTDTGREATTSRLLFVGNSVCLLNPEQKNGIRIHVGRNPTDQWTVIGNLFGPLAALVDRERMAKYFTLSVAHQDESYTYVMAENKGRPGSSGLPSARRARIVFTNTNTKDLPLGTPRQLWCSFDVWADQTVDITKWRLEPARAFDDTIFQVPDAASGWRVNDLDDAGPRWLFGWLRDR